MSWFLGWFPAYRALLAEIEALRNEHARLTTENLRLNDRLDALHEDRTRLWELTQECLRGERTAYQMHVNQSWQRIGGGVPYPEAPHLPPQAVPKPGPSESVGRSGRILPSEAVAQQTNEFIQRMLGDRTNHKA
jgi:hypothetical protein